MALAEDEVKCAKCGVKWKNHGMNVQSPEYHPMMWTNLEYLEWCSYNKDYENYKKRLKRKMKARGR